MKTLLCFLLLLLSQIPARTVEISPAKADFPIQIQTPTVAPNLAPVSLSAQQVNAYVRKQAEAYGVNPSLASCIVAHESEDGWQEGYYDPALAGHEPNGSISYGVWQFNDHNADFDHACATNLGCSTKMAMQWILAGDVGKWSTYWLYCK